MITTLPADRAGKILRLARRRWTYDDLREAPESMERHEIIDGVLYMSPSAHVLRHQNAVGNLFYELKSWVRSHGLGKVFVAPADIVPAPDRVLQPDILFVSADRLHIVGAYIAGAPDLVVEVTSPSSVEFDRKIKFAIYEEVGVKEYWLVDPENQSVEVYTLREGRYEQAGRYGADERAVSVLLAGFSVEVHSIFEKASLTHQI